jgi:hypothetical protein
LFTLSECRCKRILGPFPRAHRSVETRHPILGWGRFNKLFYISVFQESVDRFSTLLHLRPFGQFVESRGRPTSKCKNNSCPVESEVLAVVVMKSSVFWDMTPCSPLKVNRCFGGICRLNLQGRKISRSRNQRESRWLFQKIELCLSSPNSCCINN